MAYSEIGDAENAVLLPVKESEFAQWRRKHGANVLEAGGRYWETKPRGFYHAAHWLARMHASEARSPSALAWGFRTTLRDEDSGFANGSMPVHLLTDVENYNISTLSSKKRNKLRNCKKKVEIVEILKPELLKQQGYQIFQSAQQRTGYGRKLSPTEFHNTVDHYYHLKKRLILAGMIEGAMVGYVFAYAVGSTAYIDAVNLHSNALSTNVGTCLVFNLVQACQRAGGIREVVYGLDTPEDRNLRSYKFDMGFPVVHVPTRVWLAPLLKDIVKLTRPFAYYRLTGDPLQTGYSS